jgi:hypothetical protein
MIHVVDGECRVRDGWVAVLHLPKTPSACSSWLNCAWLKLRVACIPVHLLLLQPLLTPGCLPCRFPCSLSRLSEACSHHQHCEPWQMG